MFPLFGKKYHKITKKIFATQLKRDFTVDIYAPKNSLPWQKSPLILFNDGQDLAKMPLLDFLESLRSNKEIPAVTVVGIYANEQRMDIYGTAHQADYKGRGALAADYTHFVVDELIPFLQSNYRIKRNDVAVAGFSLGGLSAFDLAWHNAVFSKVGVFSGSLWWRSKIFTAEQPDSDLIVHDVVRETVNPPKLKMWLQAGTLDEDSDRNNNGIIDAIDDTLQLMDLLEQKGYKKDEDFTYVEVEGGKHDVPTWESVMGDFLKWSVK